MAFGRPPRRRWASITDSTNEVIFGPAYFRDPDLKYADAHVIDEPKALSGWNAKLLKAGGDAIWWGGRELALDTLEGNFLSLGMIGSGKSLLTNIALRSAIRSIRKGSDRRAIIFDTKGDVIRILAGMQKAGELHVPVYLISLNDQRASAWDVGIDCQRYDKAKDLATTFLPVLERGGDSFWQDASRAIVVYVMHSFIHRRGHRWGLHDVYNAVLTSSEELFEILRWFPRGDDVIKYLLAIDAPETVGGVKAQLFTQLEQLSFAAAATQYARSLISLEKFLQTEGVLVITQDFTAREASNPYIKACFKRLVELITALPDSKKRKIFVFLDECRFLDKLPKLLELVTFCRSKGVHTWISSQGIEGLRALYEKDVADEIFNQCEHKTFLNLESPQTAQWATSLIGPIPVWEPSTTVSAGKDGMSSSMQRHFRKRDQVTVRDFLELPLPNPQKGLWAYHRCKREELGFYADFTDAETIRRLSPPQDETVPVQIPRPNEELYVRKWSKAEREAFMKEFHMDAEAASSRNSSYSGAFARALAEEVFDMIAGIHEEAVRGAMKGNKGKGGGRLW